MIWDFVGDSNFGFRKMSVNPKFQKINEVCRHRRRPASSCESPGARRGQKAQDAVVPAHVAALPVCDAGGVGVVGHVPVLLVEQHHREPRRRLPNCGAMHWHGADLCQRQSVHRRWHVRQRQLARWLVVLQPAQPPGLCQWQLHLPRGGVRARDAQRPAVCGHDVPIPLQRPANRSGDCERRAARGCDHRRNPRHLPRLWFRCGSYRLLPLRQLA